jgi:hypothetical protein
VDSDDIKNANNSKWENVIKNLLEL